MSKINISYEFNLYEDADDIKTLMQSSECRELVCDIDSLIRTKLKHGDDDWLDTEASTFLEEIRELIWNSGIMRD